MKSELEQYMQAVENSNIVSKTDINGIITFVNDEFCKISGYSKEELIGQNHNIVRHPDVPKENFELLWNTILKKKTFKTTAKNLAKNGSTFYVNTTIFPLLDGKDSIKEFIAIRYDVTKSMELTQVLQKKEEELKELNTNLEKIVKEKIKELKKLNSTLHKKVEEEVEKNREKDKLMFQQARLASMGEMIGNIAHQWRQPLFELNIIIYNLKKAFLKNGEKEFEKDYQQSKKVIQNMSHTIEDFRNFFNPQKKKEHFLVKKTIEETISIIKGTILKENVTIELFGSDKYECFGYKNEFFQVILTILNNAKDALKDKKNGKVVTIAIEKDGINMLVKISDNAGGIKDEIADRIFEPYFTTKHPFLGTGLGLYMSKIIVENSLGGKLTFENIENGACFNIKIPINGKEN